MAKKVIIKLIDDLDGESEAAETVEFALDGVGYEIDLSAANAERLRDQMAEWVGAARKTGGRRRPGTRRASGGNSKTAEIRAWAQANGYTVSSRGRIRADIVEAYDKAH